MNFFKISTSLIALGYLAMLQGCVSAPPGKDYSAFNQAGVRSILVVPVVNHSVDTKAADYFLTTLPVPLAERGYYVFPINATKKLIEGDGLADPQLIHGTPTPRIAGLFGADAVMYVEVVEWRAVYAILSSHVVVHFVYTLKDGKNNGLLWQDEQTLTLQTSGNGSGNLLADAIVAAIQSAVDKLSGDYTRVAVMANAAALLVDKQGIPYGPYSPNRGQNSSKFPVTGTGHLSNAKLATISYPLDGAESTAKAAAAAKVATTPADAITTPAANPK